ncbi:hypothetical protein AYL99_11961 [Fonsecaea erecta]|uniref:Uncharacterized protein n=1 Tax=Fonsecaea erecta TaxID=1367422 RepID=A0A178Z214_9EURO|nr:hypothetical protein AYL99_11961 [Fonsecaea erecta]OAP53838.1 hypothetical protein AYL99_11961 [Fonsecaea erecta]
MLEVFQYLLPPVDVRMIEKALHVPCPAISETSHHCNPKLSSQWNSDDSGTFILVVSYFDMVPAVEESQTCSIWNPKFRLNICSGFHSVLGDFWKTKGAAQARSLNGD